MTNIKSRRWSFLAIVLAGICLHAYESFLLIEGPPSLGWFAWGLLPYFLMVVFFAASTNTLPAIAGAFVALIFDLIAHYDVFVHPTASTAALALIFIPLWNTLIFAPVTALVVWLLSRRRQKRENAL